MTAVTPAEARALAQPWAGSLELDPEVNTRRDLAAINEQTLDELDEIAALKARAAIQRIHLADFSPGVVRLLLATIASQIQQTGWKHQPRAGAAVEHLDWAGEELEG